MFSSITVYIGGNDVSSGTDLELFDRLLNYIKKENETCKVIICNSCPRADVEDSDICDLNDIIMNLAKHYNYTLADMYTGFHEKDGKLCERFYDSIHINSSGMKCFLRILNEFIVRDFNQCSYPKK